MNERLLIESLYKEIKEAILIDDITIVNKIMNNSKYENLTLEQKETFIFDGISSYYNLFGTGKILVDYIIFEYKISEANSLNKTDCDQELIEMFKIRQLQEELVQELEVKKAISKKVKI
jgi:hypothetical protein